MQGQITITLDPTDSVQVQAALSLFQKLAGEAVAPQTFCQTVTKDQQPDVKVPSVQIAKTTKAQKVEPKVEAPVVETKTEEPKVEPPVVEAKAEATVKIEEVRALLSKKVANHRDACKSKLTALGAPNVSTLKPELFQEFYDYLNTLS